MAVSHPERVQKSAEWLNISLNSASLTQMKRMRYRHLDLPLCLSQLNIYEDILQRIKQTNIISSQLLRINKEIWDINSQSSEESQIKLKNKLTKQNSKLKLPNENAIQRKKARTVIYRLRILNLYLVILTIF